MYTLKNKDFSSGYDLAISGEKYQNDYEFNRWFVRDRNRAEYYMTYHAIKHGLRNVRFGTCLEFGPGPGTWTRLAFRANPSALFDLVDISKEMRNQFMLEMRGGERISYQVADIMDWTSSKQYDLFFSSRAVEYLDDKPAFFKKLSTLITSEGQGLIVTKNPFHGIRKSKKPAHQGMIAMDEMQHYLEQNGFSKIIFSPAVIRLPIISRFTSRLSEFIFHARLGKQPKVNARNIIIESYVVTFQKE